MLRILERWKLIIGFPIAILDWFARFDFIKNHITWFYEMLDIFRQYPIIFGVLGIGLISWDVFAKKKRSTQESNNTEIKPYSYDWWKSKIGTVINHPDDLLVRPPPEFRVWLAIKEISGRLTIGHITSHSEGAGFKFGIQNKNGETRQIDNKNIENVKVVDVQDKRH